MLKYNSISSARGSGTLESIPCDNVNAHLNEDQSSSSLSQEKEEIRPTNISTWPISLAVIESMKHGNRVFF